MTSSLAQLRAGDAAAAAAFQAAADGFVALYREHARRENDETLPGIGAHLSDHPDAVIVEMMARFGPGDLGPWLTLIADLERELLPATSGQ